MNNYTNSDYLQHFGVKGMKWGVRKYQNKDGSLTDKGKKRYERDVRENNAKKKDNRINIDGPDPSRWVREDTSRAKRVVDSTNSVVNEFKNMEHSTRPKPIKQTNDLTKMSNQELRDKITRAELERRYNDLYSVETAPKVSKGREYFRNTLEVTGAVLTVTSSALAVALAAKELLGK